MTTKKAHCNACGGERNHEVKHVESTVWDDDAALVSGEDTYETLMCCGCDAIKLRYTSWYSENDAPSVTYFPPAVFRRQPEWIGDLIPSAKKEIKPLVFLLNEIYVALHNNLTSLAAMGVRALLEKVMISQSGDYGNFANNIQKFEDLGHISKLQRGRLDAIIDAGHAAMHRAYEPDRADVITLLDIAEHIIESVFLHDEKVQELKKNVPAKTPKKKDVA